MSAKKKRESKIKELQKRSHSVDNVSDHGSEVDSVISESFQLTMQSTSDSPDHIAGYLLKKSKHGEWQKRYFETNSTFLTYYKSKKMTKLLAALSMASVGDISLVGTISDSIGDGAIFELELRDRCYTLRTSTIAEADNWIRVLRKLREDATASSIKEETPMEMEDSVPKQQKTRKGEWSKANVEINGVKVETSPRSCCTIS